MLHDTCAQNEHRNVMRINPYPPMQYSATHPISLSPLAYNEAYSSSTERAVPLFSLSTCQGFWAPDDNCGPTASVCMRMCLRVCIVRAKFISRLFSDSICSSIGLLVTPPRTKRSNASDAEPPCSILSSLPQHKSK